VERVGERARGSFVEQLFAVKQPLLLSTDDVQGLSISQHQRILLEMLKMIFSDVSAALGSGAFFDRPEWAAVHLPGEVDDQGWEELAKAHEQLRLQTEGIMARSRRRLQKSSGVPLPINSVNLLFVARNTGSSDSRSREV